MNLRPVIVSVVALAAVGGATGFANAASAAPAAARVTQCAESQLRASVQANPVRGLKLHIVRASFKNTSHRSCTLTGFPGAAVVNSAGKQVQQAKRTVGGPVGGTIERHYGPVTLKPGTSAYAFLVGRSTRERGAAQAGCDAPKYPRILVTPPNTALPVGFTIGWPQCHTFEVHPVRKD